MKNKNYIYDGKEGANMSLIKITSVHCWRCGKPFNQTNPDDIKTGHHAIPEEMNPKRNVEIPVCKKCHGEIHTAQGMQPHDKNRILKKFERLEKQYLTLQQNISTFKKELNEGEKSDESKS